MLACFFSFALIHLFHTYTSDSPSLDLCLLNVYASGSPTSTSMDGACEGELEGLCEIDMISS